jgi:two-component system sensor histidine kinase YesM
MTADVLDMLRTNIADWDPLEDTPMVLEKKSIGLINIDRRIKLLYGTRYGISVDSSLQKGTKVTLALPMERINQK